jgi:hypothetical protein
MLSRNRSSARSWDARDRTSTGIKCPPLIPVDGVDSLSKGSSPSSTFRAIDAAPRWSPEQPTSLELLRQLEACVRELLEINSKER